MPFPTNEQVRQAIEYGLRQCFDGVSYMTNLPDGRELESQPDTDGNVEVTICLPSNQIINATVTEKTYRFSICVRSLD